MIVDLETDAPPSLTNVDVCVVGGGPAAIALSLRLADKRPDWQICLLEAGGLDYETETQQLYQGFSTGHPYFPLESTRLRFLGGTSGHWTGWCTPFLEHDLEDRSWIPDSKWPLSIDDVRPYHASAGRFLELPSDRDFDPTRWLDRFGSLPEFAEAGLRSIMWQHSDPVLRAGTRYRGDLQQSNNLQVWLHSNVTRLNLQESGNQLTTVEASTVDGARRMLVQARHYVLACGGVENARLMLDSDQVAPNGIGNDNGTVGRYFMDHFQTENALLHSVSPERINRYRRSTDANGAQPVSLGFCPTPLFMSDRGIAGNVSYFTQLDRARPTSQLEPMRKLISQWRSGHWNDSTPKHLFQSVRNLDMLIATLAHRILPILQTSEADRSRLPTAVIGSFGEQVPNASSRIMLSDETDRLGNRKPVVHWQLSEQDHRSIRESTLLLGAEFARLGIGRMQLQPWLSPSTVNWPDYIISAHHPMGTTRMSANPRTGVVDSNCRVHGMNNLYIAGSSVFATGSHANPTFMLVALAQRLADFLSQQ